MDPMGIGRYTIDSMDPSWGISRPNRWEAIACPDVAYAGDDPQIQDAGGVWVCVSFFGSNFMRKKRGGGGATILESIYYIYIIYIIYIILYYIYIMYTQKAQYTIGGG